MIREAASGGIGIDRVEAAAGHGAKILDQGRGDGEFSTCFANGAGLGAQVLEEQITDVKCPWRAAFAEGDVIDQKVPHLSLSTELRSAEKGGNTNLHESPESTRIKDKICLFLSSFVEIRVIRGD